MLSPSSSFHVMRVAISYSNVIITYDEAGCSKQCGLRIAFMHTPAICFASLTRDGTGVESIQQFSCDVLSNQLHTHYSLHSMWQDAASNAGCASHLRIKQPFLASLTRGCTGVESIQQFSCDVCCNQLFKRGYYI